MASKVRSLSSDIRCPVPDHSRRVCVHSAPLRQMVLSLFSSSGATLSRYEPNSLARTLTQYEPDRQPSIPTLSFPILVTWLRSAGGAWSSYLITWPELRRIMPYVRSVEGSRRDEPMQESNLVREYSRKTDLGSEYLTWSLVTVEGFRTYL